jgi:hypothetical protein
MDWAGERYMQAQSTHYFKGELHMKLNPPKKITYYVAVVLALLGLIFQFIAVVNPISFWLLLVAFILLAAGNIVQGL